MARWPKPEPKIHRFDINLPSYLFDQIGTVAMAAEPGKVGPLFLKHVYVIPYDPSKLFGVITTSQGFATIGCHVWRPDGIHLEDERVIAPYVPNEVTFIGRADDPAYIFHHLDGVERWRIFPELQRVTRTAGPYKVHVHEPERKPGSGRRGHVQYQLECGTCERKAPVRKMRYVVVRDYSNHDCRGYVEGGSTRTRW